MLEEKKFAVLIDADNVSAKYVELILDEISDYGVVTYKRIYGDWTKSNAASWKDVLLENSITPIQQYSYTIGKNATDAAMIIDAMDILYSGNVEGFCLASSDSDFTKLASRLRESGMFVVGMGEKKTPKPFIVACNQFKYLDILAQTDDTDVDHNTVSDKQATNILNLPQKNDDYINEGPFGKDSEEPCPENSDLSKNMTDINVIKSTIIKMMNEIDSEDQSMNMGELGSRLVKRYPDFDVRNYGDKKLSKFLKKFDFLEMNTKKDGTSMWVSFKPDADPSSNKVQAMNINEENKQNQKKPSKGSNKKRYYKKK